MSFLLPFNMNFNIPIILKLHNFIMYIYGNKILKGLIVFGLHFFLRDYSVNYVMNIYNAPIHLECITDFYNIVVQFFFSS